MIEIKMPALRYSVAGQLFASVAEAEEALLQRLAHGAEPCAVYDTRSAWTRCARDVVRRAHQTGRYLYLSAE